MVEDESYFSQLVYYIHLNPQKHGFIADFREYLYSSYHSHLSSKPTKLQRETTISWFGDSQEYVKFHEMNLNLKEIDHLLIDFE